MDHRRRIAMAQPRHRMDRPEAVAACREVCCDGVVARAWQVAGFAIPRPPHSSDFISLISLVRLALASPKSIMHFSL